MSLRHQILASAAELGIELSEDEIARVDGAFSFSYGKSAFDEAISGPESGVLHYPVLFDDNRRTYPDAFYEAPRNLVTNWKAVLFDVGPTAGLGAATIAANPWLTPLVAVAVAWKLKGHSRKKLSSSHAKVVWAIYQNGGKASDETILAALTSAKFDDDDLRSLANVSSALGELSRAGIVNLHNGEARLATSIRLPKST